MNRKIGLLLGVAVLLLILSLVFYWNVFLPHVNETSSNLKIETSEEEILVEIDKSHTFSDSAYKSWRHILVTLNPQAQSKDYEKLEKVLDVPGDLIVTVYLETTGEQNLLHEVMNGTFDKALNVLFSVISAHQGTVLLRPMPDMEVPVKLLPWQYQAPSDYINAFRYFSRMSKKIASNTAIIWGPSGYPGLEEYWPGSESVDLVSMTLDSKSEHLTDLYPKDSSLAIQVKRKVHRLRFMPKKILVFGSKVLKSNARNLKQISLGLSELHKDSDPIYNSLSSKSFSSDLPSDVSLPIIGVYDPDTLLVGSASVTAEHLFVDLLNIQNGGFESEFRAVIGRKHDVILSIEPWRDGAVTKDNNVLLNTITGVYDREFQEIYRVIANCGQTVYLRFAHEMEIPIHRYAWQSQDPVLYIKAFRYFMKLQPAKSNNIQMVWGPAGDRGSMEWWPGADVVDYVSIAIYGLPDKNITDPSKQESFRRIFDRKAGRINLTGKPIFITEFGVKGPEEFKSNWLLDAVTVIKEHPEIEGVSYFNFVDNPEVWGDIPAPEWSISQSTFERFVKKLTNR